MIIFTFTSCEKDSDKSNSIANDNQIKSLARFTDSEFGISHNNYLDEVANLNSFPNHTFTDLYDLSVLLHSDLFSDEKLIDLGILDQEYIDNLLNICVVDSTPSLSMNNITENSSLTPNAINYINELNDLIISETTHSQVMEGNFDYLFDGILKLQMIIDTDNNLSDIELEVLSYLNEVAYYSSQYWLEAANNPDHAWYNVVDGNIETKKQDKPSRFWRGLARIGLDAAAFTVTFVIVDSAIPPPAGSSAGVALGTLVAKEASSIVAMPK